MFPRLFFAACAVLALLTPLTAHDHDEGHGHTAAHGGCLNELGACENGHAEVKIEGTRLRLWLVGGGQDTTKAVPIADPSITLTTKAANGQPSHILVLLAKPLVLGDETVGHCSYFEGEAAWLNGLTDLEATGTITFKGAKTDLIIDWPHGYDHDDCGCDDKDKAPAAPQK
jgi:hypothetical protein